jgi:hypothetical protein
MHRHNRRGSVIQKKIACPLVRRKSVSKPAGRVDFRLQRSN